MGTNAPGLGWMIWLMWLVSLAGQAAVPLAPKTPLAERVYLSYLDNHVVQIPGRTTGREFLFRLPEHVGFAGGSELHLVLRGAPELWRALCSLRISLNDRALFEGSPSFRLAAGTGQPAWHLSLPAGPQLLERAWNRVTLQFFLCKPESTGPAPLPALFWEIHDADSFLTFAFERLPLFPELRRFPYSMVEEELLRLPFSAPDAEVAPVAVLIPPVQRDIHRRAVVALGACLGKPGYLRRCSLGVLSDWESAVRERHGLIVGLREELKPLSLPESLRKPLARLDLGQGLLAEHIFGDFPQQHRWILVTGADEAGLEKALQTLVCAPALLTLPPNPSVIEAAPNTQETSAKVDSASRLEIPIRTPRGEGLSFRGIYDTEQNFLGWQLPFGLQTDAGGYLELAFRHSTNLLAAESFLEVMLQGQFLGRMGLAPETASGGRVRLELPAGLTAIGPLPLTFRAHLDVARADCAPPVADQAWLMIAAESRLVCRTAPLAMNSLSRAHTFLLSNPRLSDTVILLPARSSLAELSWLLDFARQLGQRLSFLEMLWPDVRGYGPNDLPPASQWQGRRILLLGSVRDWSLALPTDHSLVIRPGQQEDDVQIQGRRYKIDQFEPSLALLNLVDAPVSAQEKLLVAGGWQTWAGPALTRMLIDPDSPGNLHGVVCARDAAGRSVAYDPRHTPRESLAESLLHNIPPGLTMEETVFERFRREARTRSAGHLNFAISLWLGVLLVLLAGGRIWLLWERARIHHQMHRHESQ
jgi:hypothetical protein